jgi:hypothetical protein
MTSQFLHPCGELAHRDLVYVAGAVVEDVRDLLERHSDGFGEAKVLEDEPQCEDAKVYGVILPGEGIESHGVDELIE